MHEVEDKDEGKDESPDEDLPPFSARRAENLLWLEDEMFIAASLMCIGGQIAVAAWEDLRSRSYLLPRGEALWALWDYTH